MSNHNGYSSDEEERISNQERYLKSLNADAGWHEESSSRPNKTESSPVVPLKLLNSEQLSNDWKGFIKEAAQDKKKIKELEKQKKREEQQPKSGPLVQRHNSSKKDHDVAWITRQKEKLRQMATRFNLGRPLGIEFMASDPGYIRFKKPTVCFNCLQGTDVTVSLPFCKKCRHHGNKR